jgi:hypothetical protein
LGALRAHSLESFASELGRFRSPVPTMQQLPAGNAPLTFRFSPTYDDVADVTRALLSQNPRVRRWTLVLLASYLPAFIAIGLRVALWIELALLAIPVGWMLFSRLYLRHRIKKAFSNDRRYSQEYCYGFSAAGMHCQSEDEERDFPWAEIAEVKELQSAYVFIRADGSCVLPKRAIATLADDRALTQLIRAHSQDRGAGLAREIEIAVQPANGR